MRSKYRPTKNNCKSELRYSYHRVIGIGKDDKENIYLVRSIMLNANADFLIGASIRDGKFDVLIVSRVHKQMPNRHYLATKRECRV